MDLRPTHPQTLGGRLYDNILYSWTSAGVEYYTRGAKRSVLAQARTVRASPLDGSIKINLAQDFFYEGNII